VPKAGLFLRAVNLGGRRLTMADLKRALAAAGHPDAETVAATGNAIVEAAAADATLEDTVTRALERELGQTTEVFARDGAALGRILDGNPFAEFAGRDPAHMVVVLLRRDPAPDAVEALRGKIVGPETVAAGPCCLYAAYPNDIGHSKLTAAVIERALADRGTARNWNTMRRMAELTAGP
jgi:uncharacterized protein (DUF1697 family)